MPCSIASSACDTKSLNCGSSEMQAQIKHLKQWLNENWTESPARNRKIELKIRVYYPSRNVD